MKLAMIGLGKMGGNMARRLSRAGIELVLLDQNPTVTQKIAQETGGVAALNLSDLVAKYDGPRFIWLMLPSGQITQTAIDSLTQLLKPGDTIIDGANSFYKDSQRRAKELAAKGIHFLDVGVSGGVWGEKNGYALMFGGPHDAVYAMESVFKALAPAPDHGWLHCGPAGSGHFVKMIHNGIEYGMMQSFAEGLSLLHGKSEFNLDLGAVTEMWRHGSVVRSWLLDLTAEFLKDEGSLQNIAPVVADSGEGRWTVLESVEQGIPAPVMSLALMSRFSSQGKDDYGSKLLAMMRNAFGGHTTQAAVPKAE